jgi:ankyrin repeat protein
MASATTHQNILAKALEKAKYPDVLERDISNLLILLIKTKNMEIFKALVPLKYHSDSKLNNKNHTCYIVSAKAGNLEFMKYLESIGCEIEYKTKNGHSAFDIAGINKNAELRNHILSIYEKKVKNGEYSYLTKLIRY